MSNEAKCPFSAGAAAHAVAGTKGNADWWPEQLNLKILHQRSDLSNPMGEGFDYAKEFQNTPCSTGASAGSSSNAG